MAAQPTEPIARPTAPGEAAPGDYTARHLSVLEGLEAVRKRPGMYVGSTDSRGLMHCLWEIIDNSVDEALAGHCDRIDVVLLADGSVEVRDDGRGIPVDEEPKTGLSGVEVVFTKLHAGGKFGGGSYTASGGLHGVGRQRRQRAVGPAGRRGRPRRQGPRDELPARRAGGVRGPEGRPVRRTRRSRRSSTGPSCGSPAGPSAGVTGTRVRYWADRQIFLKEAGFSYDELVQRARQTSYLVPGLTLVLRDERGLPGHARGRRAARGDVLPPRRHRRVRRLPRHRRGGDRRLAARRLRALPRDRAGPRRPGPHDADRGRAGVRGRHRGPVGQRLRHQGPLVRQHHRHAQGRHPRRRASRRALLKTFKRQVELNARRLKASGKDDRLDKEDVLAGLTGDRDRPAGRAAVRGADQGGARHQRRPRHRVPGGRARADQAADLDQARREAAGGPPAGEGRRRDEVAGQRPPAQGDPAPQERAGVLLAAGQAGRLPHATTSSAASCSSSRATARSARPSWPAARRTRRCCRSGARSSTSRRPRSPTCCATPSAPRSSR